MMVISLNLRGLLPPMDHRQAGYVASGISFILPPAPGRDCNLVAQPARSPDEESGRLVRIKARLRGHDSAAVRR